MVVKKVAISTWWHYHNYGTALQVTALYSVLKQIGYEPSVISYVPSGRTYPTNSADDKVKEEEWAKYARVEDKKRDEKFDQYVKNKLTFTKQCKKETDFAKLNKEYDTFIVGSDQIWLPSVFDERYFLNFVRDNRKKVAYAPSFGLSVIENDYVRAKMSELISQFACLSVREERGAKLIKEITDRNVEVVLDPTLLLEYSDWRKIIKKSKNNKKEKYILCYFLGPNENAWRHVEEIKEQFGYKVKILPIFSKDKEYGEFINGVGPEDFFNLIDGSEMVLTDSFHGVIFSMICRTPFFVFERFERSSQQSQNSRIYNLLSIYNIKNRLIRFDEKIKDKYDKIIDFRQIEKAIEKNKNDSIKYLKKSLVRDDPLVSIIVPVYNVEEFIKRCLDSITKQTYKNIEIIVVDDGTPDSAGEIADECAKKDKRIKVIHKTNGGLSVARNTGYDAASGEYVVFVDSDDAIAPDYVEYMVGLSEITGKDMVMSQNNFDLFNWSQVENDKIEIKNADDILKGIEYNTIGEQVWNKMYRKAFLDKYMIRHMEEVLYGEGNTFNHYVLSNVGSVGVGRRRVYYYRYNTESSTRKFVWNQRMKSFEFALDHRQKIVDKKSEDIRIAFQYHKWNAAMHIIKGLISIDGDKKYVKDYRKWRKILRKNVAGTVIADKKYVDQVTKKRALRSFFFPILTVRPFVHGFEWELRQKELFQKLNNQYRDKMPWETPALEQQPETKITPVERELIALRAENDRLLDELASHMSIKRAARLTIGNIKRRIKYGKKR